MARFKPLTIFIKKGNKGNRSVELLCHQERDRIKTGLIRCIEDIQALEKRKPFSLIARGRGALPEVFIVFI